MQADTNSACAGENGKLGINGEVGPPGPAGKDGMQLVLFVTCVHACGWWWAVVFAVYEFTLYRLFN
jgi:hypothetical protein